MLAETTAYARRVLLRLHKKTLPSAIFVALGLLLEDTPMIMIMCTRHTCHMHIPCLSHFFMSRQTQA